MFWDTKSMFCGIYVYRKICYNERVSYCFGGATMYKLAIIEDEDFIRERLVTIIDWEKLGYIVIDTFEDAIEIVDRVNEFDVILSDIKMPRMTGLDLAKYLYETQCSTKLVLLSAFSEFDYAKKAITYGVSDYLTKPINTQELEDTFQKLLSIFEKNKYDIVKERKDFYINLILGSLDRNEVEKNVKIFEPTLDVNHDECVVIELKICDYEYYANEIWEYDKSSLLNSVCNFFDMEGTFLCRVLIHTNDRFYVFLSGDLMKADDFVDHNIVQIRELMNLEMKIIEKRVFLNMLEITKKNILFDEALVLAKEKGKMLYSMISANNVEASIKVAQNILNQNIDYHLIIEEIYNKMTEEGKNIKKMKEISIYDIDKWVIEACGILNNNASNDNNVISEIKNYIYANYHENISLEELSQKVYLNHVYLGKLFKDKAGENFSDFLLKVRMEKAKELLMNIGYKVYEVGELVGYKSMKHFYRVFKAYTGYTPTEYKKRGGS